MELDDLQNAWAAHGRRLDEMIRLNRRLLRTVDLGKTRSAMQRLRAAIGVEIAIGLVALVALGAFIGDELADLRFVLPAVVLDLAALVILVTTVRQAVMVSAIDYDGPVATIQRHLEALRAFRIRCTQGTLLLAPLLWTPLLIVGLRAMFGVDAYVLLGPGYLIANLLLGLAFVPAMLWACRRYADHLSRSPWIQRLARDVAGTSLTAALGHLASIAAFEHEEGGA